MDPNAPGLRLLLRITLLTEKQEVLNLLQGTLIVSAFYLRKKKSRSSRSILARRAGQEEMSLAIPFPM